ncbi:MAG: HAD family phosphatase [Bacteroidota bacterium]
MENQIKNIIFDLGGVLINLDYKRSAIAFEQLGITSFDRIYNQKKQEHLFDDFEKGVLSEAAFRNEIRIFLKNQVMDDEIDNAWNAMLLDIPDDRIQLLHHLKTKYRIFLLSNTNAIHVKSFSSALLQKHGVPVLDNLFEQVYYSCFMKMRKPDAEIFNHVLKENKLDPSSTIFIDDSLQHVEGAEKTGIKSYLLKEGQQINELVTELKLL